MIAAAAGLCCVVIAALMALERQQSLHKLRLEAVRWQSHSKELSAQLRDFQPADSTLAWISPLGCGLHTRCGYGQLRKRTSPYIGRGAARQRREIATRLHVAFVTSSALLTPTVSGIVQLSWDTRAGPNEICEHAFVHKYLQTQPFIWLVAPHRVY